MDTLFGMLLLKCVIRNAPAMTMMKTRMMKMRVKVDESRNPSPVNHLHHHKEEVIQKMDMDGNKEEISKRPFLEGEKDDINSWMESSIFEDP